jgi:small multidrug resistance pump
MLFLSGSMSAVASILLRIAGQTSTNSVANVLSFSSTTNMLRISAVLAYGAGFVLYALALKRIELSIAYPIMVGVTILEIFAYGMLGGDGVNMRSVLGAGLIMSGILLIYSQ